MDKDEKLFRMYVRAQEKEWSDAEQAKKRGRTMTDEPRFLCDLNYRGFLDVEMKTPLDLADMAQLANELDAENKRLQKENGQLQRHLESVIRLAEYYSNTLAWSEGDFLILSEAGAFLESIKKED